MTNPIQISYLFTCELKIDDAVRALVEKISHPSKCVNLVFFGDTNTECYNADFALIKTIVTSKFECCPLLGFVGQPLCGPYSFGVEITELSSENTNCEYKTMNDNRYLVVSLPWGRTLLVEGIRANNPNEKFNSQNNLVFQSFKNILTTEGFKVSDIVRQWNYIGNILKIEDENQHYQLFNNARSLFYDVVNFEHGFPAATGISMSMNSLFIAAIAIQAAPETKVIAIDNSLQIPAYNYSQTVLISAKTDTVKARPKFERAKLIANKDSGVLYVSGTAAIRNEASMSENDASLQTMQTIENINFLISEKNLHNNKVEEKLNISLKSIRVYIKKASDYQTIKALIESAWPTVKAIYVQAEVCRDGLLVEIEGIAS